MDPNSNPSEGHTPPFLANHGRAGEGVSATASPQKSIGDYLAIIKRRWWIGLIIGVLLGGFNWWQGSKIVPMYNARAVILFEQETDRVLNIQEVVSSNLRGLVDTILRNHHTFMISNTFRARVIEDLSPEEIELIVAPYRDPETNPDPSLHGIIARSNKIHRGGDNIFFIEFQHRSGEAAAFLANRFVEEYNDYLVDRKREGNTSAMRFLRARAEELRLRVEQSELAVQEYRKNKDLVSLNENQNLIVKRLQSLDSSLTQARIQLLELETSMQQIREAQENDQDLLNLPLIANYGAIPGLLRERSNLRTQRDTMKTRYGRRHPRIIENEQAMEAINKELEVNRKLAIKQLENNLAGQRRKVAQFEEALAEAEKEALELDRVAIEFNVLRRKLEADKALFDQINARLNETTVASQLSLTNLRIVDLAGPPASPFMPDTKEILLKSLAFFAICFVGIPFVIEFFDKKIKSLKDIELHLRRLHLGNIPKISKKTLTIRKNFQETAEELNHEWFRAIFGQTEIYSQIPYPKIILITSSIPQEGKSFFLAHFAYHLSRHNKKVLVLDADYRNPQQAKIFGIDAESGSNEWLRNRDATRPPMPVPNEAQFPIHRVERRLHVMPAGKPDNQPTEILSSQNLVDLIANLQNQFDVILIDSPPAGVFPDASLLTKISDEIIYVIKAKAVSRNDVKTIIRDLEQSQARFLGTVLNFAKPEGVGRAKYYSKYKKYYEDETKGKKSDKPVAKKSKTSKKKSKQQEPSKQEEPVTADS